MLPAGYLVGCIMLAGGIIFGILEIRDIIQYNPLFAEIEGRMKDVM